MSEKLYYIDSHLWQFDAAVTGCEETKGGFAVTLDRTAFFPEGGGQLADTGSIGPARVLDVHEKDGRILHYTDRPLPVGERFACAVDAEQRLRRMQNHSGEHIVSGLVYREHGFDNVGFHMGPDCMTMDYSGELSWEQLMRIERLANEAVRADLPLKIWFPPEEELASLFYRSKLDLTENVRIVEIPGIDRCACCAPHVERTGEVGLVKILTAERHRGGVRITALCGMDAWELAARQQESVTAISGLLSVPRDAIVSGVERLLELQTAQKERIAALSLELARLRVARLEGFRHRHLPAVGARRVAAVPLRANIVNIAEQAALDLIFRFVIENIVMALVSDREVLAELRRGARHFFTFDNRVPHELFAQNVQGRDRVQVERQTDNDRFNTEFFRVAEQIAIVGVDLDVLARFVFRLPAVFLHETATRGERGVAVTVAVERAILVVRTNVGDRDDLHEIRIARAEKHAAFVADAQNGDPQRFGMRLRIPVIERA